MRGLEKIMRKKERVKREKGNSARKREKKKSDGEKRIDKER